MKVKVSRLALLELLGHVQQAMPKGRPVVPVTSYFLLQAQKGKLVVAATNLSQRLTGEVRARDVAQGGLAVPRSVCAFLKATTVPDVVLTSGFTKSKGTDTEHREYTLSIAAGGHLGKFKALDPADFPPGPKVEGPVVKAYGLAEALGATSYAMSAEDIRPALHGAFLSRTGKGTWDAAAADGFRLAIAPFKVRGALEPCILPIEAVELVVKHGRDQVVTVQQDVTKATLDGKTCVAVNAVSIKFNGLTLVTQVMHGTFPNYPQLVPTKGHTVKVHGESLREALKVAVASKPSSGIVRLMTRGRTLLVKTRVGDEDGEVVSKLPAKGAVKIAFNIAYLREIVDHATADDGTFTLKTTTPSAPGVATANKTTHVVMPMFVAWDTPPKTFNGVTQAQPAAAQPVAPAESVPPAPVSVAPAPAPVPV